MIDHADSLENILGRLKSGKPRCELDLELLSREVEGLDVDKRVFNPMFDSADAERRFGVRPICDNLDARRAELSTWISKVMRPPYFDHGDELLEEEHNVADEFTDAVDLIERIESSAGTPNDESQGEPVDTPTILTALEEEALLLAFNYAKHRLAAIVPRKISSQVLMTEHTARLLELAKWTLFGTEIRELLIEFHYPFVVKRAHAARRYIGKSISIRDMICAGIEGLKKAINMYDRRKGSPRLVGFASRHVVSAIIKWFNEVTNWTTSSTRAVEKTEAMQQNTARPERERIPIDEIFAGIKDAGWAVVNPEDSGLYRQRPTRLGVIPLQDDPLKLDKYIAIAQVRKAAAAAATAKTPVLVFRRLIRKAADILLANRAHESAEEGFASPEWQLVWRRRMLSLDNSHLRRTK